MLLNTGVYTVSQPAGVRKPTLPRSAMAPCGVPKSSGTTNARANCLTPSAPTGKSETWNCTSSLNIPMLPTGIVIRSVKIGRHCPGRHLQVDQLVLPFALELHMEGLVRLERGIHHETEATAGLEHGTVAGVLRQ